MGASTTKAEYTYKPTICRVLAVTDLTPVEKLFRIELPEGFKLGHKPGQFVQVSMWGYGEAPISVTSSPTREEYIELGVRNAGTLTEAMHGLQPNDELKIRGPFGSHFDVNRLRGKDLILIAGGCGLAPLRSLIQYCEDRRSEFKQIHILYGAQSVEHLLYKSELLAWERCEFFECQTTVDRVTSGSCHDGRVGLITQLIPPLDINPDDTIAAIVGPPVMYPFVIEELQKKGLTEDRIVVSLERHMKCGVGKCGHCTIEHLYCCIDGPVFWLNEVSGLRGAL